MSQRQKTAVKRDRLYHHTTTCLPIHPKEIDIDSEGEPDPEWLRMKTAMMIDEFTDVNEGEKELMKMWNLHVLKYNYVGDCQIPYACKRFVEMQGKELIRKNLYRNFILHLTSLFDFGLLSPHGIYVTVQQLHSQMKENNTATSLRDCWRAHLNQGSSPNFAVVVKDEPSSTNMHLPCSSTVVGRSNQINANSTATVGATPTIANSNSNLNSVNGILGSHSFSSSILENSSGIKSEQLNK